MVEALTAEGEDRERILGNAIGSISTLLSAIITQAQG
jgi:hypothetical protein